METQYEFLPSAVYYDQKFESFAACEGHWVDWEPKFLNISIQTSAEVSAEMGERRPYLEGEAPYELLRAGKVLPLIPGFVREKNQHPKCPLCGSSYKEGAGALSRRDNKTFLCSDCGNQEAFGDLFNVR